MNPPENRLSGCALWPLLALAALLGCTEGSSKRTLPQAEVQLSASHYVYALSTLAEFTAFPVPTNNAVDCYGTMVLRSDSTYVVDFVACSGDEEDYALERSGQLSILTTPNARSGRVRYLGAYGLDGDTGAYYFTDRYTSSTSNGLALFWGTRIAPGTASLEGGWHLFSQHVVHTSSQILSPDNVGRTLGGTVDIDGADAVSGTALESTQATIALAGSVARFDDSRLELDLTYTPTQGAADRRFFRASAGTPDNATAPVIVLGLDTDTADGEVGLLAMLRKRTSTGDPSKLAGQYFVGVHTIFVDASIPGSDVAHGELEFNATGEWSLSGLGAGGIDFSYAGTYTLADDGALALTVNGTGENWRAAVDEEYRMVVIADNFVEARPAGKPPELNLMLALRQSPPSNP